MLATKYLKVVDGLKSHASGFEYKIDEVNVANVWNPNAGDPKDFGGFNFSTEDKILRWLLRGDTLYDVEIPNDAEVVEVENSNTPHGVFRTNKIIISNPRPVTDDLVIELYKKSSLLEKTYYQCLVTLLFKKHIEAVKYIIRDRINENNVARAIEEFESFISKDKGRFNYSELWDDAKEIYDILKEIQSELDISISVDKAPYVKEITNDRVINLTGESGSGKSYFANQWKDDCDYIVIDTDIVFSDKETDNEKSRELRKLFRGKSGDFLIENFDYCYKEILNYFKDSDKIIVIDSAQYRNIKDVSIIKGKVVVMRTSIDKCYERCIKRWKDRNKIYSEEELQRFKDRKLGMYKWYKRLNEFIKRVDKLESDGGNYGI